MFINNESRELKVPSEHYPLGNAIREGTAASLILLKMPPGMHGVELAGNPFFIYGSPFGEVRRIECCALVRPMRADKPRDQG
jgi:hypothetical protein